MAFEEDALKVRNEILAALPEVSIPSSEEGKWKAAVLYSGNYYRMKYFADRPADLISHEQDADSNSEAVRLFAMGYTATFIAYLLEKDLTSIVKELRLQGIPVPYYELCNLTDIQVILDASEDRPTEMVKEVLSLSGNMEVSLPAHVPTTENSVSERESSVITKMYADGYNMCDVAYHAAKTPYTVFNMRVSENAGTVNDMVRLSQLWKEGKSIQFIAIFEKMTPKEVRSKLLRMNYALVDTAFDFNANDVNNASPFKVRLGDYTRQRHRPVRITAASTVPDKIKVAAQYVRSNSDTPIKALSIMLGVPEKIADQLLHKYQ